MKTPDKYRQFVEKINAGDRKTLPDDQTKLFILTKEEIYIIKIDNGVIQNVTSHIRKCDFAAYNEIKKETHLIELKGKNVAEAFEQIKATIKNINQAEELAHIINDVNLLDSYIVSPISMRFPQGVEEKERELAKILASKCKSKVPNILDLIKYVTVVPKTNKPSDCSQKTIKISNAYPLEL